MYKKYYEGERRSIDLYAYAPPGTETGDYYVGQNVEGSTRTLEAYKTYKEVGFNMVMSGCSATYYGEDWQTSMCKRVMDLAYEAGLEKFIVGDQAFYELSCEKDGIVGEGKKFATEKELDEFVANRIKDYSKHPIFTGIYLKDEPHYYLFKSFGEICRSVKRVRPETYVYCNLLPLDTLRWMDERYPEGGDLMERRTKYLEMFLDETGCDYIMYDDYTFCYNKESKVLLLRCLQHAAEVCRDRGVELRFVAQSFSMKICGQDYYWVPNEQEMRYQLNLLLGFGVRDLGFFTYMPHGANSTEQFPEDGAMITKDGKKMQLYYDTQKVIREIQEIIPVVTRFDYVASAYAVKTFNSFLKQLDYLKNDKLKNVRSFSTDREGVLVNELYDKDNDKYLYRVINVAEVRSEEVDKVQTTTLKFDEKFKFADLYKDGKWSKVELCNGRIDVSLLAGDSAYLLIY